jgi:hypothetical protein
MTLFVARHEGERRSGFGRASNVLEPLESRGGQGARSWHFQNGCKANDLETRWNRHPCRVASKSRRWSPFASARVPPSTAPPLGRAPSFANDSSDSV